MILLGTLREKESEKKVVRMMMTTCQSDSLFDTYKHIDN